MKTHLMVLIVCFCTLQKFHGQEDDGVVALTLPVRNSLTFNRYTINPTFSFVREQTKYISIFNKREWVQFEDAPLTYLASYSGRFAENIGAGIGVFQQNYGVLTTFGGVLNFAYNARMTRDNNLTFGLNIGAYKSGLNTGNVVTNFSDPALQNVPENFLLTVSPGINYGTVFLDFGIAINNLATYNFNTSELIEDNPEQSIQAHIMYTGYMNNRGFFEDAKFSGLLKSEFSKDDTVISGLAMLTIPKGLWGQVGYNTRFGISGGIGLNITEEIALEYNYEKAIGDLSAFGPSHAFTLAYRFKNRERYDYSSGDEITGLITKKKKRPTTTASTRAKAEANRELAAEEKARKATEAKEQEDAEAEAKLLEAQKAKEAAEAQAKQLEAQKAKEATEARAKELEAQKTKEAAEARAKQLEAQKAKEAAEARAKQLEAQKAKEAAEARAKELEAQKAKEAAEAQAKELEAQKAKEAAEARAKELEAQKAKEAAEAQAQLLEAQKAQEAAKEAQQVNERISNPKDELGKAMYALTQETEDDKLAQTALLKEFDDIVTVKNQDLKDLKEENDLSEQGIAVAPKPFKSITAENNALRLIQDNLEATIKERSDKIANLKALYDDKYEADTITNDEVVLFYKKTIKRLEAEQLKAIEAQTTLEARLERIRVATEFERRRRIKRAAFDNEEERYAQDRATLKRIKETTTTTSNLPKAEDFDFGEEQSNNITILKNVQNVEDGYYLIVAVHSDVEKRDDFIRKVVASGRTDIDFFYDINTSNYYIYYNKFDNIEAANEELKTKGSRPYNTKMSLVKIEN